MLYFILIIIAIGAVWFTIDHIKSLNSKITYQENRIGDKNSYITRLESEKYDLWKLYLLHKGKHIKVEFYRHSDKVSVKLIKDYITYEIENGTGFKPEALTIAYNYADYQLANRGFIGEYAYMIHHDCMKEICEPALAEAKIWNINPTLNINTKPKMPDWQNRLNSLNNQNLFNL